MPPEKPRDIAFFPSVLYHVQRWWVWWIRWNGKGHFGPTNQNDQTGQSELPSKVVPNRRDPFNQNPDRSDREKRTPSKGGPVFSKLFRLDRTDPLSFGPKFPEILVEWIAPNISVGPNRHGPFHFMWASAVQLCKPKWNVTFNRMVLFWREIVWQPATWFGREKWIGNWR